MTTPKRTGKIDEEELERRKTAHQGSCSKKFEGKSGAMEAEAAVRIWGRSEAKLGMKYRTFIGDGDSKAFDAVVAMNPYDTPVVKEECVNHVGKRLGTRLRKLKAETA